MLRYLTSGESHGKSLTAIIDGMPANMAVTRDDINSDLARRQKGYGRGGRMKIETDEVEFISGVRSGKTMGSPITMMIANRDWENWSQVMASGIVPHGEQLSKSRYLPVTKPRPGHADLPGAIKYNQRDVRNILERSSARETAVRTAVGAVAKRFLNEFNVKVYSWVNNIGSEDDNSHATDDSFYYSAAISKKKGIEVLFEDAEQSVVRCPDSQLTERIKRRIDDAKENGDSLGGVFEVVVRGVPVGLGSHVQWDRKLDMRLAGAVMSIQAIKGVEIGLGFKEGRMKGSDVHDEIFFENGRYFRSSNSAGGIEGGMTNGEDIVVRAVMKPIPTLYKPLKSVDIETKEPYEASVERSDVCAVPAAAVICEAVVAFEVASAFLDKFGGDSMEEVKRNYAAYLDYCNKF